MKTSIKFFLFKLLFLVLNVSYAQTPASSVSKADMQNQYVAFLQEEGLLPRVDTYGDVRFEFQQQSYYIEVHEEDPYFFRMVLMGAWKMENPELIMKVQDKCVQVTYATKVCTAFINETEVWFSTESLLADPQDFKKIFKRSLSSLEACKMTFLRSIEEQGL
ncbi:hypothetical protein [Algivirga pacifica]|uniref:DUF4468 domain-containing protein n=1 Tax=Algivirga pacifica TaxID=1162670 RepID=A0ABP9D943_9BACT